MSPMQLLFWLMERNALVWRSCISCGDVSEEVMRRASAFL